MVNGVNTVYVGSGHCIFPQQKKVGGGIEPAGPQGGQTRCAWVVGLRCLGQGKMEGCPAALFRFDPDLSPVIFYDFVNDCKP